MTAAYERQRHIAASFARQYYTALLQKPEVLPGFYTPDASFEHMGCKAQGSAEIETAVKKLYPAPSNEEVDVASLLAVPSGERGIRVTIKGTISAAAAAGHTARRFTHEVQLLEHPTQPGCFGITADTREETAVAEEPHPTRWACETPPMFAEPPAAEAMEPIVQPAATTAVAPVDPPSPPRSATPEAVSKSNATAAAESPTKEEAPAESQGESTSQEAPPAAPEPKKPRSFAEAIMMSRRAGAAPSTSVPVTVVAKESKEQPAAPHAAPTRDAKGAMKGTNGRKPTNAAESERRDGRPAAAAAAAATNGERPNAQNTNSNHASNGNNRNGREGAPKPRREGEGRMLSQNVIFFDVIVKGLPANATEQTVRDIVEPTAPVKLIKLLSQKDKKDTSVLRTFAFVQFDHDAIKETGEEVQSVVTKLLEGSKGRRGASGQRIQIDKVREKYTAAPAPAPAAAPTAAPTAAPAAAPADVPAA